MRGALARLVVCAAIVVLAAQSAQTQATPPQLPKMTGSGIVFGTVIADDTRRPLAGASVIAIVVSPTATFTKSTTTDRLGRFVLTGLAAGQVRLSGSSPGYLGGIVGQSRSDDNIGSFISMGEGQILPIVIRLARGASISGLLADDGGDPIGGVAVQAFGRSFRDGRPAFVAVGTSQTDDRGAYRIANLPAGTYAVGVVPRAAFLDRSSLENIGQTGRASAEPIAALAGLSLVDRGDASSQPFFFERSAGIVQLFSSDSPVAPPAADGTPRGYVPTFYPSVPASQASTVTVGPGEDRAGISFSLAAASLGRISGRIISPSGTPPPLTAVTLVSSEDDRVVVGDSLTALVSADGQLVLPAVAAGSYRLEARSGFGGPAGSPDSHRLWASVPVTVGDSAQVDVQVVLHEALSFAGSLHFEGHTTPPTGSALAGWAVTIAAATQGPPSLSSSSGAGVQVDVKGHFAFVAALVPGDYRIRVGTGLPSVWSFASVTIDGHDGIDTQIHLARDVEDALVTMSDERTEISGAATTVTGAPATAAVVVAFPQDAGLRQANSRWIGIARPRADGQYQISNLPPGDYFVAIAVNVEQGQWNNLDWLKALQPLAVRVTLAVGEKHRLDLRSPER